MFEVEAQNLFPEESVQAPAESTEFLCDQKKPTRTARNWSSHFSQVNCIFLVREERILFWFDPWPDHGVLGHFGLYRDCIWVV